MATTEDCVVEHTLLYESLVLMHRNIPMHNCIVKYFIRSVTEFGIVVVRFLENSKEHFISWQFFVKGS